MHLPKMTQEFLLHSRIQGSEVCTFEFAGHTGSMISDFVLKATSSIVLAIFLLALLQLKTSVFTTAI